LLDGIQSFAFVCFLLMAAFFVYKGKPTSVLVLALMNDSLVESTPTFHLCSNLKP